MSSTKGRKYGVRWVRGDDPIFNARHWVFYGPRPAIAPALNAVLKTDVNAEWPGRGACLDLSTKGTCAETLAIVIKGGSDDVSTLVHEASHAMFYAFRKVRVKLTRNTTELFAYYHEWLVREGRKGVGL